MSTLDAIQTETKHWVKKLVIGLNLCPFADHPYQQDRIAYAHCKSEQFEDIYRELLLALDALYQADAADIETTLFIVPKGLEDFDSYLEMLSVGEAAIAQAGLEGVIQLASFHPNYVFEGCDEDDPANYSNRSPYPMFHLIREASLEQAVAHYDKPEEIPERNVALLREMGIEKIKQLAG